MVTLNWFAKICEDDLGLASHLKLVVLNKATAAEKQFYWNDSEHFLSE